MLLQVLSRHEIPVRPDRPAGEITSNSSSNGGKFLSEDVTTSHPLITEAAISNASGLRTALETFDKETSTLQDFALVTDGQLCLRQCLLPEAQRKHIRLPKYFYAFHDLRKEFLARFPEAEVNGIEDMAKRKHKNN